MTTEPKEARIVELRRNVMKKNDELAHELRSGFRQRGTYVVNLVSSPGSGKTMLLEKTLRALSKDMKVAALVGDLATDNDAQRLAAAGVPVHQITTGTICHLDADMIGNALGELPGDELDLLFIENVGNLVCPSSYDLGENVRAVLVSVTEGEDKPLKYPTMFNSADVAIITKMDLAEAVEADIPRLEKNIRQVRPDIRIFHAAAKKDDGLGEWLNFLRESVQGVEV